MSFFSQAQPPASLSPHSVGTDAELPPGLSVARPGTPLSSASAPISRAGTRCLPSTGVGGSPLPFGSPSVGVVAATGSWSATKAPEGTAKTNGVSDRPVTALRAAGWGRGAGSLSPQPERCWAASRRGAVLGELLVPRCPGGLPAARPGRRARPRPVRRGCPGAGAALRRSGSRAPAWHGSACRGHGGAAPLASPARGQESPAQARLPLPRSPRPAAPGPSCPVGSSPGRPLQARAQRHSV